MVLAQKALQKIGICFLMGALLILQSSQAGAEGDTEENISVEEHLQRLSSVRKVMDRRDPFEENNPSYVKEERSALSDEAKVELGADDLPPILRYPAESYTVKAVLLGDRYPRALIKMPNGGSAIVQERMRLGDKNGIIERIDRTGIKIVEQIKNTFGSFDTVPVTLPMGVVKSK